MPTGPSSGLPIDGDAVSDDAAEVYLVWHCHHWPWNDKSRPTEHRDEDGELLFDPEDGDLKILGIFTTRAAAEDRVEQARHEPGFQDEPDCFYISTYTPDELMWTGGFVSEPYE